MRKIWVQMDVADLLAAHPLAAFYPFTIEFPTEVASDARYDGSSVR